MSAVRQQVAAPATVPPARTPLRRTCACGTHTPLGGECEGCRNRKKRVQARFAIGGAGDAFEREADAVADQVMRRETIGTTAQAPVRVQRHADRATDGAEAPSSVDATLGSGGAPLEPALRADMEARFGQDFSHVRTHTDAAAGRSAHEINAAAYTAGHHIVFGRGRYEPQSPAGRRLIAHELTHVLQQTPGVVRRQSGKKGTTPKKSTAADSPKLDYRPARNSPPCACIVFMHHDEKNARLIANSMHELCKYNLAIVEPAGGRSINLPAHGLVDPNELFPRHVAEACWDDDEPCRDFMAANAGRTDANDVKAYAERQFFLAIKQCSNGFTLPVVALHNNTIDDTASYRADIARRGGPDVSKIEGKTFDKSLEPGSEAPEDTLPFDDQKAWEKTLRGVSENKSTGKLTGGPFKTNKTNILIWCNANDNTKCHIGDPWNPDNVVWVTNEADFNKLSGKKVNVALQTRVDPKGNSKADLSSLFVFLGEIVGAHYDKVKASYDALQAKDAEALMDAVSRLTRSAAPDGQIADPLEDIAAIIWFLLRLSVRSKLADSTENDRERKLSQVRYVNIETPGSSGKAGVSAADFRVISLNKVRSTLAALGLDCCDTAPAPGQTESAAEQLEKAVHAGPPQPKGRKP